VSVIVFLRRSDPDGHCKKYSGFTILTVRIQFPIEFPVITHSKYKYEVVKIRNSTHVAVLQAKLRGYSRNLDGE